MNDARIESIIQQNMLNDPDVAHMAKRVALNQAMHSLTAGSGGKGRGPESPKTFGLIHEAWRNSHIVWKGGETHQRLKAKLAARQAAKK